MHSAIVSILTPTSAVLFAFTVYGKVLMSIEFVHDPSQFLFSYRHSSIPTIVMLIPTSFSICAKFFVQKARESRKVK